MEVGKDAVEEDVLYSVDPNPNNSIPREAEFVSEWTGLPGG